MICFCAFIWYPNPKPTFSGGLSANFDMCRVHFLGGGFSTHCTNCREVEGVCCAMHCQDFGLSDPDNEEFRQERQHEHDMSMVYGWW